MSDTKQLTHYIDGQWVAGSPASDSLNPSDTRDIVAQAPGGDKKTVDSAVAAAKAAFPAWANASPEVRSDLLDKVGALIMARADELGRLLSREEGKTFPEGKGEVMRAARASSSSWPARHCAATA
jgi:aldehyde dehydrogenase (NAD+)